MLGYLSFLGDLGSHCCSAVSECQALVAFPSQNGEGGWSLEGLAVGTVDERGEGADEVPVYDASPI